MDSRSSNKKLERLQARVEVENMRPYSAPLEGRRGLLRLDFNENTLGPSPKVIEALKNISPDQISVYPEYQGLKKAIISTLGSKGLSAPLLEEQIGIFNGVDAAINAIFHAYGDRDNKLLTTTPTFGYYRPCAEMRGMSILACPYEGDNFKFPINKIKANLTQHQPKLLLICNPNNPTGTILEAKKILDLAKEATNTLIVIDELYEAFGSESVIPIINFEEHPNIVVLRSLSKTAGLAGLRIGFAIAHSNVVEKVLKVIGPYDINSIGVIAAFAALKDQQYIDDYVEEIFKAKAWMKDKLSQNGIKYHLAGGNYLLIWPKREPLEIERLLRSEGILVRNMKGKELIDNTIRVSIGNLNQMKQFWSVFQKLEKL